MSQNRPTAWVQYKDSFFLCVAHVTRAEVERITEKHKKIVFKNHQRTWATNTQAVARDLCQLMVVSWRGLTYRIQRLILCQERAPDSPPDSQLIEPRHTPAGILDAPSIQVLLEMESTSFRFSQFLNACWQNFEDFFEMQQDEVEPSEKEKREILEEEAKNS